MTGWIKKTPFYSSVIFGKLIEVPAKGQPMITLLYSAWSTTKIKIRLLKTFFEPRFLRFSGSIGMEH